MSKDKKVFGALEAGGTKMVAAIIDEDGNILKRESIPTETPEITIPKLVDFFKENNIDALGIGSFGPVELDKNSKYYGHILNTPKKPWKYFDIVKAFEDGLHVPVGLDTDVNSSMLGEAAYGCAKGIDNAIYVTIGTGIGAGVMVEGNLLHGMQHPECGHILLNTRKDDPMYSEAPVFFEDLAAGPSIEKRWGARAETLYDKDEVWELEAHYIALGLANYIMILSPKKIIVGGGVSKKPGLIEMVRDKTQAFLAGYLQTEELEDMDSYIVLPSLNDNQGILGCAMLAQNAMK